MKYFMIAGIFLSIAATSEAQTKPATQTKQRKVQTTTTTQQRGTGQYHGARDTTPGSPMGTGGAGGGEMAGSPGGSAIETKDQTQKAKVNQGNAVKKQPKTTSRKVVKKQSTY
jgi:hypothetical protein